METNSWQKELLEWAYNNTQVFTDYFLQSEIHILDENYEVAIKLLEYIEKLNPFDEEISLQRANIASKKGDHISSINYLHKALKISDDPDEIWNLLGMEHLLVENYIEASYFFKTV